MVVESWSSGTTTTLLLLLCYCACRITPMVLSTAAGSSNVAQTSDSIWRAGLLSPPAALLCIDSPKFAWDLGVQGQRRGSRSRAMARAEGQG